VVTGSLATRPLKTRLLGAFCIAAVTAITIMVWRGSTQMVPYVPIVIDLEGSNLYLPAPLMNTPAHQRAMATVLDAYHEKYEQRADGVYISRSLQRNVDLLQNYTSKAEALSNPLAAPAP